MNNIGKIGYAVLLLSLAVPCVALLSGSLDEKKIIERIKPVGAVTVEGGAAANAATESTAAVAEADIGKHRYETTCKICHDTGLAGAPKFGDKSDWKPRIAQGMDQMVKTAITGLGAMPPRGTCNSCSDEEIKKTVEYMVSHSQ